MGALADRTTRRVRRPLANAHWALPVAIVAAWCLFIASRPCAAPDPGTTSALSTATVLVVAWASHLRAQASSGWRKLARVTAGLLVDLALLLVAVIVCMLPIVAVVGSTSCMTPKARAVEVLLSTSAARVEIAERAHRAGTLAGSGKGLALEATSQVVASMISDDGTILVAGGDPLAVFVLRPSLAGGVVTWRCSGSPRALTPGACR